MTKKCEIWVIDGNGKDVLAGLVVLEDGDVSVQPRSGFEPAMRALLRRSNFVNGKPVRQDDDPLAWFEALPKNYNGSRMAARMML